MAVDIAARIRAVGESVGRLDAKKRPVCKVRCQGCGKELRSDEDPAGVVEALEEEIRMRNIWGLHVNVPMKDLKDIKDKITLRVVDIVSCVALLTLRDEFGFGGQRGRQFLARFEKKVECVVGDPEDGRSVTLEDYLRAVKDEMGISLTVSEGIGRRNGR